MFAAEIKKKRSAWMRGRPQWRWHLDEVFVRINGEIQDFEAASEIRFDPRFSP